MKAIILAGGMGTRLRGVVRDLPKPMAPVNGRPFLDILIARLVTQGVTEIILSVGYLHDCISKHFGNGAAHGASIEYCVEHEPLGTGGAVGKALQMAGNGDVLVLNGDTFAEVEIKELIAFHLDRKALATIAVLPVADASRYGTVVVSPEGMVEAFSEKSSTGSNLVNAGVYVFNSDALDLIPPGKSSLENDVLPQIVLQGRLAAQIQQVPFIDIGLPDDYYRFCRRFSEHQHVS
jgi:NDP-sugar pyrophosphorylase family protein